MYKKIFFHLLSIKFEHLLMDCKNKSNIRAIALAAVALICFEGRSVTADSIRELIESGDYATAIQLAEEALAEGGGDKSAGQLYQVLGEAQYHSGMRKESSLAFQEAKDSGVADASLYLGRLAMLDYRFDEAQTLFGRYAEMQRKAKRPLDVDLAYDQADVAEGKRQFERMQDVVVIDAVQVPREDFFRHLRLPLSAGRVVASSEIPAGIGIGERGGTAFISESGELMMWSELNDSTGMMQLVEATRLMDGSISAPHGAPDFLGQEGDVINPFLSADGTTLYYAANGENSVGGYDLFIATRDPQTGDYLQPVNAGIPFNSSADEYIMAIDEENGVGWWATDRHYLPDGKITLYVYVLPEERRLLQANDEEKRLRARLDDIRLTWTLPDSDSEEDDDGTESLDDNDSDDDVRGLRMNPSEAAKHYTALAAGIRKIEPGQKPRRHDCVIPLPGGGYIYSADDVKSADQKKIIEEYIVAERQYRADKERLAEMRRDYARQTSRSASGEIARLENEVEHQRDSLTALLSAFYRSWRR